MENGFVVINKEMWEAHLKELADIRKHILEGKKHPKQYYMTHDEVMQFFGVSDITVRRYRDSGELGFSQVSKKVYMYKWSDVEAFIEAHYKKPFAII